MSDESIQDRAHAIRERIMERSMDHTTGMLKAGAVTYVIEVLIERLATLELIVSNLQARMDLNK